MLAGTIVHTWSQSHHPSSILWNASHIRLLLFKNCSLRGGGIVKLVHSMPFQRQRLICNGRVWTPLIARESYMCGLVFQESRSGDIYKCLACLTSSILKERPGAILKFAGHLYTLASGLLQSVQDFPQNIYVLPSFCFCHQGAGTHQQLSSASTLYWSFCRCDKKQTYLQKYINERIKTARGFEAKLGAGHGSA